jgi:1-acyl-sn-glycerol-3-phosphate acyltransferase
MTNSAKFNRAGRDCRGRFSTTLLKTARSGIWSRVHQLASSSEKRPEDKLSIRVLRALDVCFARIYHQVSVGSPHRLPRNGAGILVCNHISALDPVLIQSVCPRLIVWMMAREYYDLPLVGRIFRMVEAIPVDRSGRDMGATRAALRALSHGRILGVFPEGRIETSKQLLPFQTGVALMAMKTGLPVYPAHIEGSQRGKEMLASVITPNSAKVSFGVPIFLPRTHSSRDELQDATARIEAAVAALS